MNRLLLGYNPDFDLFDDAPRVAKTSLEPKASLLEADHTEAAVELLETAWRPNLPALLARLISRAAHAAGGTIDRAQEIELIKLMQRAARVALPTAQPAAHDAATQAGRFFGIELEGLSPEDQEFESARRFIQLVEAAAAHAAAASRRAPPAVAAWQAAAHAARRFAPGWSAALRGPPQHTAPITAGGTRPHPVQGAHHA